MFFLSIIPIPLFGDNKKGSGNEIDSIETKIKALEGFITAEHLGQPFDADQNIAGNQTIAEIYYKGNNEVNNIDFVQKELEKARQEDIELRRTTGHTTSDDSPVYRLSEIDNKLLVAEQRIRDLSNFAEALKRGSGNFDVDPYTPGKQIVSGLNTAQNPNGSNDLNVVNAELNRALAYKQDLESAKDFWEKIGPAHENIISNSITKVTKDEMENNVTGIKKLEQLHDLLNSLIKGLKHNAMPELNTPQNPHGSDDANVVRQALAEAMFHFETRIQAAKKQSWYPELKAEMQNRLRKIEAERKNAEKEATALEKQLYENLQHSNPTVDLNTVRQNLYRQRALVGELNSESQFLNSILNPQNTEHSTQTKPEKTPEAKPETKPKQQPPITNNPSNSFTGSTYTVSHLPPKIDHNYDFTGLNGKHHKKKKKH